MEEFNAKIYDRYTALKKRKLLDDGLERKRDDKLMEYHNATKDLVSDLQKENKELFEKLSAKEDELVKARTYFLEEIRAKDDENLRLKNQLAEMTDQSNSTAAGSLNRAPEIILDQTPIPPAKETPQSNSKGKGARSSEEAIPSSSSPEEEARELECSRRHTCTTGNGRAECSSAHILRLLLESLVRMKISLNEGTERTSVSVSHEASGYSFTLTWLEQPGEWLYEYSSLGTLKVVSVDYMKEQGIRFTKNMCRRFFEGISKVIPQG